MVWHLKPFSSRHCFSQSWQYQRRRCKPFDFSCLDTDFASINPRAFTVPAIAGVKSSEPRLAHSTDGFLVLDTGHSRWHKYISKYRCTAMSLAVRGSESFLKYYENFGHLKRVLGKDTIFNRARKTQLATRERRLT